MENNATQSFNQFATTLGMAVIILTVIYSDEKYDMWDLLVGVGLLWVIDKHKKDIVKEGPHVWLARIWFSVSAAVIVSSLASGLYSLTKITFFDWEGKGYYSKCFIDIDFIISLLFFMVSSIFIKEPKVKK